MSPTTTGAIAVTLGLVVFIWDARRNAANFRWPNLGPDWTSDSVRAGFVGFVSGLVLIEGQNITAHYWGRHAGDAFFYWYLGVAIAVGVIVEFVRRRAKKRAISN